MITAGADRARQIGQTQLVLGPPDTEEHTDRVIAEKWDATLALTTAQADEGAIARLRGGVPGDHAFEQIR